MKNTAIFLFLLLVPVMLIVSDVANKYPVGVYLLVLTMWGILFFWVLRGIFRGIFRFFTKPKEKSVDIEKERKDLDDQIDASKNRLKDLLDLDSDEIDFRFLDHDSLMLLGHHNIKEVIDIIKIKSDPLLRLALVYMLIEQLSDNFKLEESSIGLFTYKFFQQELSDEDFLKNFEEGEDSPDFKNYDWCNGFQDKIRKAYLQCPEIETRSNICASFCADLVLQIDDDKLKERFVTLARKTLEANNTMTKSAESSLMSVEF